MKIKFIGVLAVLFVITFVISGCGGDKAAAEKNNETVKAPAYKTIEIKQEKILDEVSFMGIVRAFRDVEISPEVSGKIKKINCQTGDKVTKGDVLLELDDEEKIISLKKKKALLKKAEATTKKVDRDAKKADSLFKDGVISDSEYDDSSLNSTISLADLELAAAEVMSTEKALRDTKLIAVFDGKIAAKEAEVGDIAVMGKMLLSLVDITRVKINVDVSEFDAAKISPGNEAMINIDSLPGMTFTGKVNTVGLKADDATRTYPVEIVVSNEKENLMPGMVARAVIKASDPRRVITLPRSVVVTVGTQSTVKLLKENKLVQKTVEIEKLIGDKVIVRSGLKPGDRVVVGAE